MFLVCEKRVETRTDCYLTQQYFFLILARLLNRGSLRAQSTLSAAGSHFGILSSTDSNRPGHLVILLSNIHLLPLFFRLFTQVHLLIDGSVEGQYITYSLQMIRNPFAKRDILTMTLDYIWWWGSSSGDLGNMKQSFIAITPICRDLGVMVTKGWLLKFPKLEPHHRGPCNIIPSTH